MRLILPHCVLVLHFTRRGAALAKKKLDADRSQVCARDRVRLFWQQPTNTLSEDGPMVVEAFMMMEALTVEILYLAVSV